MDDKNIMNPLEDFIKRWNLLPVEAAKVLRIQKSKASEYLSEVRKLPPYIEAHIETFNQLTPNKARELIAKRLGVVPKGN
ncbi:hypothetical protein [Marinobacterium sp. BA1]|uniref:hypothetical protein n=1 Tax=Marinobacterium sp. BA1 TaxID=3138931 RepID=UPI0032E57208